MQHRQPLRQLGAHGRVGGVGSAHAAPRLHTFNARREGTRGFRAPEVLMRKLEQGPAIDVWAAGVVVLCLVTRRYPVFHADSDDAAMGEIMQLLDALSRLVTDPRCARGDAAELGAGGSVAVERTGRLVLATFPPGCKRRCVRQGSAEGWAELLGLHAERSARGDSNGEDGGGSCSAELLELLDGCLRFDEEERLTANQLLTLSFYNSSM
jgi:serine/threonine protein kinase